MELTGKENARLCLETNNKEEWTNSRYTLEELFENDILGSIVAPLKINDKISEKEVKSFSIGDTIMDKRTRINAKFRASLKYNTDKKIPEDFDFECVCTYLDISDFYNFIVDLYIDYAEAFNTSVTNIRLKMIEIDIRLPVSFTNKGFINSNILNQYDLDGQRDFLYHFLKTQKWEIINNKIIFTHIINDKMVQVLLQDFKKETIINHECQKNIVINDCEIFGIETLRKNIQNKIQKEKAAKEKLERIINHNQLFYSLNLRKYRPKFTKLGNSNSKTIILF